MIARPSSPVRAWRATRATTAAAMAFAVAVLGHLAGGGSAPGMLALVVGAMAAGALAWRLSRRRWSLRTLTALVVGAQGAVHLWCSLTAPGAGGSAVAGDALASAGAMLAGHAAATVLTVVLLAHGERALLLLADLVADLTVRRPASRLAYAVAARCCLPKAPRSQVRAHAREALDLLLLVSPLCKRGPPVCA